MSSAITFICVLGILVVVHEFGHFIVAKMVGVRVEKFSIGFGPVIYGRRSGETEFCVSLLPFGGFVKLAGESAEESKGLPWEFNSKKLWECHDLTCFSNSRNSAEGSKRFISFSNWSSSRSASL